MRKPCKECPFSRDNNLEGDNPGGSDPTVYLGQARGPFWLACHCDSKYKGKESKFEEVVQCAGAAIFRANSKQPYKLPDQLLSLPENHEKVFSNEAEFFAHYKGYSFEKCQRMLTPEALDNLMLKELRKSEVKRML